MRESLLSAALSPSEEQGNIADAQPASNRRRYGPDQTGPDNDGANAGQRRLRADIAHIQAVVLLIDMPHLGKHPGAEQRTEAE